MSMRIFMILILLSISGCAAHRNIQDFPREKIDRPITLPQGMSDAHITLPWNYPKSTEYYDLKQPYPLYAYWTHALSDQFSFIWYGLPIGFRLRILQNRDQALGLEFFNHLGPPDVPQMSPYLTFINRWRINRETELESRLGFQAVFQFKRGGVDWAMVLESGPRWQVHRLFSLRTWFAILREENPSVNSWSVPVGLSGSLSILQQLDFEVSYIQSWAGVRSANIQGPTGSIEFRYFW